MGTFEIIAFGLMLFVACIIGHIFGYRTRIKDEMVGKISIVVDKRDVDAIKRIIAIYYKGELAEDVEVRAIDPEKENVYKKRDASNENKEG